MLSCIFNWPTHVTTVFSVALAALQEAKLCTQDTQKAANIITTPFINPIYRKQLSCTERTLPRKTRMFIQYPYLSHCLSAYTFPEIWVVKSDIGLISDEEWDTKCTIYQECIEGILRKIRWCPSLIFFYYFLLYQILLIYHTQEKSNTFKR